MRLVSAIVLSLVLAATAAAQDDGRALFEQRCTTCHLAPPPGSRAPTVEQLQALTPEAIFTALTTGSMQTVAIGLDPAQMRAIAMHATGKAFGAAPAGDAASMPNRCSAKPLGNPLTGAGWNGWGVDLANTRFQSANAAGLTAETVPKLKLKWAFGYANGRQAWGQSTVAGGRIYVGSDNGYFYALDAQTGCVYWSFKAKGGVRTAPTVAAIKAGNSRYAVFFGDVRANVYALDAETGAQIWTDLADGHSVARITGAPAFHEGRLYVPVSSIEEAVGGNEKYECCTFRGSLIAYDANTGARRWQTYTISEAATPMRKTSIGTQLWGPAGASIWAAPTIDTQRRRIYVSTSNGYTFPAVNTTNSVMALDLATGKRIWNRQLTPNDAYVIGCGPKARSETCPQEVGPDFAVGTSPILKSIGNGRSILAVGQKSGLAWGINPEDGTVVWEHRVGRGSPLGGIEWGGAADDQHVYYPNADGLFGNKAAGGLAAIKLATGERTWWAPPISTCPDNSAKCIPSQSAAATAIPGVVFSGATDGMMRAYSAIDGKVLWEFATARPFETVNGVKAQGGSINAGGATVVNGMVFFSSGYGAFGQMTGNVLLAFAIE